MEFWGHISYLKAGINFSERITTVSPTYAREILDAGARLRLRRRPARAARTISSASSTASTPSAGIRRPTRSCRRRYSADDLAGKARRSAALLEAAGLDATPSRRSTRPLIGLVSRLTDQKGFDLIAAAADELMALDAAWVMLGSGERRYEELWRTLAARYPGSGVDDDRLRRAAGAPDRGGRRHVPDAVAVRALRAEPAVQPALRHGADRPRDRRAQRHGRGRRPTAARAPGFKFGEYTPGALVGGGPPGARRVPERRTLAGDAAARR